MVNNYVKRKYTMIILIILNLKDIMMEILVKVHLLVVYIYIIYYIMLLASLFTPSISNNNNNNIMLNESSMNSIFSPQQYNNNNIQSESRYKPQQIETPPPDYVEYNYNNNNNENDIIIEQEQQQEQHNSELPPPYLHNNNNNVEPQLIPINNINKSIEENPLLESNSQPDMNFIPQSNDPSLIRLIQSVFEPLIQEMNFNFHSEMENMKLEMLRQFDIQQEELKAIYENSVNELKMEVRKLREENSILKSFH